MKKILLFLFLTLTLTTIVSAQSINIEFPFGNKFEAGSDITFKITLYDANNKIIDDNVQIEITDSTKKIIDQTVKSNELIKISLGDKAGSGQGTITAKYQDFPTSIEFFEVGRKETVSFDLQGDNLIIKNSGNTEYSKVIKITIGDTTRTKEITLGIGQSISYKLVAPDGTYNIKVTDGDASLIRSSVQLTGTGQAIGAIDDSASTRSPVTGGISPSQQQDEALLGYIKNNTFVYVFVLVIFAATILLAIERRYKKKANSTKR
jgi:hypothetical protein